MRDVGAELAIDVGLLSSPLAVRPIAHVAVPVPVPVAQYIAARTKRARYHVLLIAGPALCENAR